MTALIAIGIVIVYLFIGAFIVGIFDIDDEDNAACGVMLWPLLLLFMVGIGFFALGQMFGKMLK